MRRVLALVAAAAMIAGSVAIRNRMDRGKEDRDNPLRIVCAAELGPVCEALAGTPAHVTVEPAPTTADRLARVTDDDPGLDGWLVPAPWPQIVDGRRRGQTPLFGDSGSPLARSPLVLVIDKALPDRTGCGPAVGWKCLGEAAGAGKAKPGHGSDGVGALVLGQAAAAYFGRLDLSTLDLEDPNFARWYRGLEQAAPPRASGGSPLNEMLGTRFASLDAVATTEAEAVPAVRDSALRDRITVLYPAPMATADLVLAGVAGAPARRLREVAGADALRKALVEGGWRVEGAPQPPGPPLPATNGLPSPGFLDALRRLRP